MGKTGCLLHPRSRVRLAQTNVHTSIQGSWSIPAFPAQWLYGLLRALPGRAGLVVTVAGGIASADLTPASGRQDHTTSPYAAGAHVYRATRVHRIPPHVRDDRERPSMGETGRVMPLICATTEAEYFCRKGWTGFW
jgi:hypothetical protein